MKTTFIKQLKQLANGQHPETGKPLPEKSVVHETESVRLLYKIIEELRPEEPRQAKAKPGESLRERNRREGRPLRSHAKWDVYEKEQLKQGFEGGDGVDVLAAELQRSPLAISAQLLEQGLIDQVTMEHYRAKSRSIAQDGELDED